MQLAIKLKLYSTSYCHLCEQAEAMLISLENLHPIEWNSIEIMDDESLLGHYGTSIPVLRRVDTNQELAWPFTKQQIEQLISER
jgi:RNA binding exosome subunit